MLLIWTLLHHDTQYVLIFSRARIFHLKKLEKVTWFHGFAFIHNQCTVLQDSFKTFDEPLFLSWWTVQWKYIQFLNPNFGKRRFWICPKFEGKNHLLGWLKIQELVRVFFVQVLICKKYKTIYPELCSFWYQIKIFMQEKLLPVANQSFCTKKMIFRLENPDCKIAKTWQSLGSINL